QGLVRSTGGATRIDDVFITILAVFGAGGGACNHAATIREVKDVAVLGDKLRGRAAGTDGPGEPTLQIVDVNLDEIQHAANAAVGSDALVLSEFTLAGFVHVNGIPVIASEGAGNVAI